MSGATATHDGQEKEFLTRTLSFFNPNWRIMERHYNLTIRTDGRPALSDDELVRAIVRAICEKDSEADQYGPALAGYQITVNTKKSL